MLNAALAQLQKLDKVSQRPIGGFDVRLPEEFRENYLIDILEKIAEERPLSKDKKAQIRLLDYSSKRNKKDGIIDKAFSVKIASRNSGLRGFSDITVDISFEEFGNVFDTSLKSIVNISESKTGETIAKIDRPDGFARYIIARITGSNDAIF